MLHSGSGLGLPVKSLDDLLSHGELGVEELDGNGFSYGHVLTEVD
jgi:hypothetical protein